jgi:hypothetical protein
MCRDRDFEGVFAKTLYWEIVKPITVKYFFHKKRPVSVLPHAAEANHNNLTWRP